MGRPTRLLKEAKKAGNSTDTDIRLIVNPDNLYAWSAVIWGPTGTPFQGGEFRIELDVPESYPRDPPRVVFNTPVFHPNVHFKTGEVCLDILKPQDWSPAWQLDTICRAIVALLASPGADSPLNCDAGNLIRHGDVRGYESMARMYTQLYAMSKGKTRVT